MTDVYKRQGLQDFFALCRAQYPDAQAHLADSSPLPAFLDGETALLRCNSQDFSNYCACLLYTSRCV